MDVASSFYFVGIFQRDVRMDGVLGQLFVSRKKKNSTYIDEQTMKLYFVGIFWRDAGNGR